MEFNRYVHFNDLNDVTLNLKNYNSREKSRDNAILIQICPFNQIYGLYYISPRYRSLVINKFLEQPIYTTELKEFLKNMKYNITIEMKMYYDYITNEKLHIMYYKDVIQADKLRIKDKKLNYEIQSYKLNDIEIIHF